MVVARSNERANERLARHIVSTVLGVPVDRFEDGMANRQVDALIRYPDRLAALEIVADHDAAFNAQWDALNRLGHKLQVPGLRQAWMVQLGRRAKIRDVERELPAMLLAQQDSLPPEGLLWDDESSDLERLNIRSARPIDDSMASGLAYLYAEGWWGPASEEHVLAEWVTGVLSEQSDVPAKLAGHPGVAERHAFVWARFNSGFGVHDQLHRDEGLPVPTTAPTLPPGVTHVWVAGSLRDQSTLAWFPNRGWWRTSWRWPQEGPVKLED